MYPITISDWKTYRNRALDIGFNVAVLAIAGRLFPCGFDIAEDAPRTYEQLLMQLNTHKRMIVQSGGYEQTIFGDREVCCAFRAWHDWCHWRGEFDFSLNGDRGACAMQEQHLVSLYGSCEKTDEWRRILRAEILEQRECFIHNTRFPVDQRAFVENYLAADELQAAE